MKLIKQAGKTTIRMSRSEWENYGKQAGWFKEARWDNDAPHYQLEHALVQKLKEIPRFADRNEDDLMRIVHNVDMKSRLELAMRLGVDPNLISQVQEGINNREKLQTI